MILHYHHVAQELGIPTDLPLQVCVDASAFIAFSQKLGLGKMKHLDMRRCWIQLVKNRAIVEYIKVASKDNEADIFTKIFEKMEFRRAVDKLNPLMPEEMQKILPLV